MIDAKEHYKKYLDLYHTTIKPQHMSGFRPVGDWLILEVLPDCPDDLSSANTAGLMISKTMKKSEPVVFACLAAGPSCTTQVGDLVLCTFLAGDRFAESNVICVQERDVIGVWGNGIQKEG
jgi:hypothetical protein